MSNEIEVVRCPACMLSRALYKASFQDTDFVTLHDAARKKGNHFHLVV